MGENIFRTEILTEATKWSLNFKTPIFFIGSCFSDNIGLILQKLKLPVIVNPFGVVFNPLSIARIMNRVIDQEKFRIEELANSSNLWHCFELHGKFSDSDAGLLIERANSVLTESYNWLVKADFLCVTFGTAWVYEHIQKQVVVSNCHKFPDSDFRRFRVTPEEIIATWKALLNKLHEINPKLKVIFTVSPIRHTRDGAHENQLSKSTLLLAIDQLEIMFGSDKAAYFPSYEIVMDDLRDYRFYSADMIHISDVAIKYIFEKFVNQYIDVETQATLKEIEKIAKAMEHRLLNAERENSAIFAKSVLRKIEMIQNKNPTINFDHESEYFVSLVAE